MNCAHQDPSHDQAERGGKPELITDLGTRVGQQRAQVVESEREHRDAARAAGAEKAPAYALFSAAVRLGCRAAIRLSEKI